MKLRIGLLNATDEAYFESWHVRGRQANDPGLAALTRVPGGTSSLR